MTAPITADCQVISSDFTTWDKCKRFGRSLTAKAKNFVTTARDKFAQVKDAIAQFFTNLFTTSKRYSDEVLEILEQIREDFEMGGIIDFFFGPPVQQQQGPGGNYTEFSTGNVAGSMMGAVVSQNGFVSEEQVEQFGAIAQNSTENLKRLDAALKAISKVSSNETEAAKQVYKVMSQLEKDAFKRSEYQYQRRREHRIFEEKFNNLRKGL